VRTVVRRVKPHRLLQAGDGVGYPFGALRRARQHEVGIYQRGVKLSGAPQSSDGRFDRFAAFRSAECQPQAL
jgi:hypothetical protein